MSDGFIAVVVKVPDKKLGEFHQLIHRLTYAEIIQIPRVIIPSATDISASKSTKTDDPDGLPDTSDAEDVLPLTKAQQKVVNILKNGDLHFGDLIKAAEFQNTPHTMSRLLNTLIRLKIVKGNKQEGYTLI